MRFPRLLGLAALLALTSCAPQREYGSEIALSELTNHFRDVSLNDFEQPKIYNDRRYDAVVSYVTKTNVVPRHILILYIRDGRIVDIHSMVDDE